MPRLIARQNVPFGTFCALLVPSGLRTVVGWVRDALLSASMEALVVPLGAP